MLVCPCRAHQPNELFINQFNVHTQRPWRVQRLAGMDGTRLDWYSKTRGDVHTGRWKIPGKACVDTSCVNVCQKL